MVLSATRIGSTSAMPSAQRVTARTILLRSTLSCAPERLVTRMGGRAGWVMRVMLLPSFVMRVERRAAIGFPSATEMDTGRSSHESSKAVAVLADMRITAGLRASGLGLIGLLLHRFPSPFGSVLQNASFPVTAAGQLRNGTGFPLRPSRCARHRD